MIKQNLKLLIKSLHISIPLALLAAYTIINQIINCWRYSQNFDVLYFLQNSLTVCSISFLVLFYAAYEFFYQIRVRDIEETLYAHSRGKIKILSSGTVCLAIVPIFQFLISFAFNTAVFFISGMTDCSYIIHSLSVLFLYILLGGIIPLLLGIILAKSLKRVAAYSVFALIVFFVTEISDFIFGNLSQITYVNFWSLKYFLSYFLSNDLECTVNYDYGLYCEPYRWNLSLFWIFLLVIIIAITFKFKKSKIKTIALLLCAVMTVINLAGYFQGGSHIEKGSQLDSVSMSDYVYYQNDNTDTKEKAAGFKVTAYNMNLKINRKLSAEVTMTLNDSTGNEYDFTLYHGYVITDVTDIDGNNLEYERSGDYITVKNSTSLSKIVISYSGYSTVYYSNSQACALPGYFPYYPMAGRYDFVQLWGTYSPITDLPQAEFSIKIDTPKQMYSNLNELSVKNSFEGTTNCPMLFSGFYENVQSDKYNICSLTVQGWGYNGITSDYIDEIQNYIDSQGGNISLKNYKIIQLSPTVLNAGIVDFAFYCDDAVLISYADDEETKSEIAESLIAQKALGYKEYENQFNAELSSADE